MEFRSHVALCWIWILVLFVLILEFCKNAGGHKIGGMAITLIFKVSFTHTKILKIRTQWNIFFITKTSYIYFQYTRSQDIFLYWQKPTLLPSHDITSYLCMDIIILFFTLFSKKFTCHPKTQNQRNTLLNDKGGTQKLNELMVSQAFLRLSQRRHRYASHLGLMDLLF